jgi:heat shock protein HtpX
MNTLKVGILLLAITALFVFIGSLIGGTGGAVIAFGLAVLLNFGTFWFSDKLVLKMTKAQPVTPQEAPELHDMVERMAARAGIPKPSVYIVNDPSPNAFATGRSPSHAAVAVNTGLMNLLNREEVEGVVAHEIAHIKHRDTLTMTVVATIAGAIMVLATFARFAAIFGGGSEDRPNPIVLLLIAIIAPLAATLIQLAISRAREYEADRLGAELAGTPHGLANALLKLEKGSDIVPSEKARPQTAPLYIVNPLRGGGVMSLFMTHPPIEKRVAKLLGRSA